MVERQRADARGVILFVSPSISPLHCTCHVNLSVVGWSALGCCCGFAPNKIHRIFWHPSSRISTSCWPIPMALTSSSYPRSLLNFLRSSRRSMSSLCDCLWFLILVNTLCCAIWLHWYSSRLVNISTSSIPAMRRTLKKCKNVYLGDGFGGLGNTEENARMLDAAGLSADRRRGGGGGDAVHQQKIKVSLTPLLHFRALCGT
jgi:hypothetical protein